MIYLVDANVLSEPTKHAADRRVITWLNANESNLIVDSMIIGERDFQKTGVKILNPFE